MKIYTRTGDQGDTGLFGGGRVSKTDARIGTCGTIDEFNATLGLARAAGLPSQLDEILLLLQNRMFDLGAEITSPDAESRETELLQQTDVNNLEGLIDSIDERLPTLSFFILPGGTQAAATLHLARCVCRRAERELVALSQQVPVREIVLSYVNRVSDLLFVMARAANAEAGVDDVRWEKLH
jgi:cob(I)alamin adenosyltransferase